MDKTVRIRQRQQCHGIASRRHKLAHEVDRGPFVPVNASDDQGAVRSGRVGPSLAGPAFDGVPYGVQLPGMHGRSFTNGQVSDEPDSWKSKPRSTHCILAAHFASPANAPYLSTM